MTQEGSEPSNDAENSGLSLLPDPDLGLRVRQAEFARIVGVSRTTVTRWRQEGVITVGADGLLDPRKAARQVLNHVPAERLRAKVLRPLVNDQRALRAQIDELTEDRDAWKAAAEAVQAEADALRAANAILREDVAALEQYAPADMLPGNDDEEDEDDDDDEPEPA